MRPRPRQASAALSGVPVRVRACGLANISGSRQWLGITNNDIWNCFNYLMQSFLMSANLNVTSASHFQSSNFTLIGKNFFTRVVTSFPLALTKLPLLSPLKWKTKLLFLLQTTYSIISPINWRLQMFFLFWWLSSILWIIFAWSTRNAASHFSYHTIKTSWHVPFT